MSVVMRGNYIFVERGQKAYKVASNYTNYLELGSPSVTAHYLVARIESDEFVIDGILLGADGQIKCKIARNFPEKSTCRKEMTPTGYRIHDADGNLLLGIDANGNICSLKGTIYGSDGTVLARDEGDDFLIFRGPAILGKSGNSLGIVLG